jgi:glycosyltransferase involved in cell wall biosynthesis
VTVPLASPSPDNRPWLVASPAPAAPFDGIHDFANELTQALRDVGPAELFEFRSLSELSTQLERARVRGVFLQYSPPAFVHRDVLSLLPTLSRLRARGVPVVVTVHEYWASSAATVKQAVWRWLCRRTLTSIAARSLRVVATTSFAAGELRGAGAARSPRLMVVPGGSTVPRTSWAETVSHPPLIAMIGQPSALDPHVVLGVARWLANDPSRARWVWVSRSLSEMRAWWRDLGAPEVVEFRGELPMPDVSALLAQASLGMSVAVDGTSFRRSSLTALLAHGLPVVGLDGRFTDDLLRTSGAALLSPQGDAAAFTANLERLLDDAALRRSVIEASEQLFASRISWPSIVARYLVAATPTD